MSPRQNDEFDTDHQSPSRRQVLKYTGGAAVSLGVLSSSASANPEENCAVDPCTRKFLTADPVIASVAPPLEGGQWDGETIEHDKSTIMVGVQVPGVPKSEIAAPFSFDPIVTCVQAGTTVNWEWRNQDSISTDIPVTVHHNVGIFEYTDDCEYETESFVTSGKPEGFNPPEENDPVKFRHTFDEPGVYPYYCEPHGYPALSELPSAATNDAHELPSNLIGMRGAVIVTDKRGEGR